MHCGEAPCGLLLGGRVLPSPSCLPSGRGSPGFLGLPGGNKEKTISGIFQMPNFGSHSSPHIAIPLLLNDCKSPRLPALPGTIALLPVWPAETILFRTSPQLAEAEGGGQGQLGRGPGDPNVGFDSINDSLLSLDKSLFLRALSLHMYKMVG